MSSDTAEASADALTRACGERLATLAAQATAAPDSALPAIADLCTDTLVACASVLAPGASAAYVLAQLLRLVGGDATQEQALAALQKLRAADLDAALQSAIAAAAPLLSQAGLLGATATPPVPPAGVPPAGVPPTLPGRTGLAKWVARRWGEKVPGTPKWSELAGQLRSAATLTVALPRIAQELAPFGLRERPSSSGIGKRVQARLEAAYRNRHPESYVVLDSVLWRGKDRYGDISRIPLATGDAAIDQKLPLTLYAYGFPSLGQDTAKPGFPSRTGKRYRPDMLDLSENKLFEIKPVRGAVEAVGQLWAYQTMINAAFSADPSLGTVQPGWWRIPLEVFSISDDDRLWAFAFMFPGVGTALPAMPGIVLYMVFEADPKAIEDAEWLAEFLEGLIARILMEQVSGTQQAPRAGEGEREEPEPETDGSEDPDSWVPNGHYPGDEQPETEEEDEPEQPWEVPAGAQSPGQAGQHVSSRSALDGEWAKVVLVVVIVVVVLVVAAWFFFGGELELLGGAAVLFAGLGFAVTEGPQLAGAAAILILVVHALRNQVRLSPATAELFQERGDSLTSDVAFTLARLPGLPAGALQSLGLSAPSTGGSSAPA